MNCKPSLPDFKGNKRLKFIKDLSSSRCEMNLGCQEPDRAIQANIRCLALSNKWGRKYFLGKGMLCVFWSSFSPKRNKWFVILPAIRLAIKEWIAQAQMRLIMIAKACLSGEE